MKSKKYKLSAKVFYAVIMALALGLPNMAFAGTIQLPKTGQTKCYDTSGAEISCAGTGQDGDIRAGVAWPSPRFTDNGNGTVTDNLTGLMWTKDANPVGNSMTWQQALDYVKTLNTGGHTDWRLPNVNELNSLVDYSSSIPALPLGHPFTNVRYFFYWSSTTGAIYPVAWLVGMDGGFVGSVESDFSFYAWPVRAGGSFGTSTIYTTTTTSIKPTTTTVPPTTTSVKPTTTIPVTTTTTIPGGTSTTTIPGGTTTTTTIRSNPCPAEAIYGEQSEQSELLREYRDNVLSKTPEGQELIKTYYKFSPSVTNLLEQRPLLKHRVKAFIDSIRPGIREKVEESDREQ